MSLLDIVLEQKSEEEIDFSNRRKEEYKDSLKQELIDALGLSTVAHLIDTKNMYEAKRDLTVSLNSILNSEKYSSLTGEQKQILLNDVLNEIVGLGPIQPLLDDPDISEVMINGCKSLFYEKGGRLYQADEVFSSPEQIMMVVERILAPLGRRLDETCPIVSARLKNGDRVNAVISPIALDGPIVTIRKFSAQITSLKTLVELGSLPLWYAKILSWAVKLRCDIAVCGGTGSGKTTLLNALSCEIDESERIVTIEDSAELKFDTHPHVVRLETRSASIEGKGEISIRDLVKNALRMRPDRIVVGEVRGSEAIDMLQAMNTGHDGSLTTLHAGSEKEAILRLVLMSRFGMDLPTDVIEGQIATAIDLIVMSRRMSDGKRFITSACEVILNDKGTVSLKPIIEFDVYRRKWKLIDIPNFIKVANAEGVITTKEVDEWKSLVL